ncbi:MAG TPA: zf-HC2 domain-containing protein [Armatimonadota bacterium]|nr:zf-HC2 domain-containing protein [Armatimonadota bacterium]
MNCRYARKRLSEYIDGELSAVEHARIRAHLGECTECRAEEAALRRTASLAQMWGVYQPGPELRWRLDSEYLAARARSLERLPWSARLQTFAPPAAVAMALLLAVGLGHPFHSRRSASESSAPARRVALAPPRPAPVVEAPAIEAPKPALPAEAQALPDEKRVRETRAVPAKEPVQARPERPAPARRASRPAQIRSRSASQPSRIVARVQRRPSTASTAQAPAQAAGKAPAKPEAGRVVTARLERVKLPEPLMRAEDLYASGRYLEAAGVLNAAIERSSSQMPERVRSVYVERNALADATIAECSMALLHDPGNANARKFLDEAYESKVELLRSLAG